MIVYIGMAFVVLLLCTVPFMLQYYLDVLYALNIYSGPGIYNILRSIISVVFNYYNTRYFCFFTLLLDASFFWMTRYGKGSSRLPAGSCLRVFSQLGSALKYLCRILVGLCILA